MIISFLLLPRLILIAAAVIPGIFLMRYIYQKDRLDKESPRLLAKLFVLGIISTLCAIFTETIGCNLLDTFFYSDSLIYMFLENFIVVALSEEGFKYMVLKRATWKAPEFNCSFDAVVYAVFVSLGFAVWENIKYVFSYGFGTALIRAVTAVPGHACFGVLMGACYGMAKRREIIGNFAGCKQAKRLCIILPVIAHGAYDFVASLASTWGSIAFTVLILLMYFFCFNLLKGLSEGDEYIGENPDS